MTRGMPIGDCPWCARHAVMVRSGYVECDNCSANWKTLFDYKSDYESWIMGKKVGAATSGPKGEESYIDTTQFAQDLEDLVEAVKAQTRREFAEEIYGQCEKLTSDLTLNLAAETILDILWAATKEGTE